MKKKYLRLIAVILSVAALTGSMTACGRDLGDLTEPAPTEAAMAQPGGPETVIITIDAAQFAFIVSAYGGLPVATAGGSETPSVQMPVTPATVPQPAGSQPVSSAAAAPTQGTPAQTAQPVAENPLSYSKGQLLTYFNNCVNKIKTDLPALKREKQTKVADIQLSNSLANSVVGFVKSSLLSEDVETKTVAKGASSNDIVSVEGQSFVSALTESDIANISATAAGSGYTITVNMPDLVNPDGSSAYAKIFQFLTVDDVVNIYAPKIGATVAREDIAVNYKGCYARVTVDDKGRPVDYETYVACVMSLKNGSIKKGITIKSDVDVTLYSTTKYSDFVW
ncbi:MAG: hypothetical protein IJ766_04735 [Clostridia bacterium]|nr:hypothetical protein [Clostridia bacterium]